MSMFDLTDEQVKALYVDAREHLEARNLRAMLTETIYHAMKDVVREVGYGDATPDYFDNRADLLLDRLMRVCNGEGWDRVARPIMAKEQARQQMQMVVEYLSTKAMLEPPSFMRDLMAKPSTTQPIDE